MVQISGSQRPSRPSLPSAVEFDLAFKMPMVGLADDHRGGSPSCTRVATLFLHPLDLFELSCKLWHQGSSDHQPTQSRVWPSHLLNGGEEKWRRYSGPHTHTQALHGSTYIHAFMYVPKQDFYSIVYFLFSVPPGPLEEREHRRECREGLQATQESIQSIRDDRAKTHNAYANGNEEWNS